MNNKKLWKEYSEVVAHNCGLRVEAAEEWLKKQDSDPEQAYYKAVKMGRDKVFLEVLNDF